MTNTNRMARVTTMAALLAATAAAGPATKPAATAVEAAKQYTDRFKHRDGAAAVEATWDMDGMFDGMFGDAMTKVSAADRAEMRRRMLTFLKGVMANPQVADAMATATYDGFAAGPAAAGGRTTVAFDVTLNEHVLHNTLDFVRKGKDWRIVDAATDGRSLVKIIHDEYAKNAATVTPQAYVKEVTAGQR